MNENLTVLEERGLYSPRLVASSSIKHGASRIDSVVVGPLLTCSMAMLLRCDS